MHTIKRFNDSQSLSQHAAELLSELARAAVEERGRFLLAISGGGTPRPLFERLAQPPFDAEMPWAHTHVLWSDERNVLPIDEESNFRLAMDTFLEHVPIPAVHIHRVKGELSPEEAAADYREQLAELAEGEDILWPRLDCVILGMGSDGHTASLFPGSPVVEAEPVVAVTADYDGRPAERVTLTPVILNAARHLIFLVTGASKAETLAAVLEGPYDPENLPAQRIHPPDGKVIWLVDEAAAERLSS